MTSPASADTLATRIIFVLVLSGMAGDSWDVILKVKMLNKKLKNRGEKIDSISIIIIKVGIINPNSLDNKGSWRILKDFYCSVTLLRELG